jgi:S-formylglutathione hydrolase FrmB
VGRDLDTSVVVPAGGGRGRPLLVLLHGRGGDDSSMLDDAFFAAVAGQGRRAPVVALPEGAESYWHDRRGAAWGRYVMDEVIPTVARRFHTDPRRVAIGGVSMGGFGALDLARLHPGRFCAAGGHSPAIWETGGETAAGALDDAADFDAHDLIAVARDDPAAFAGTTLWLDHGDEDPFRGGDRTFVDALRDSGGHIRAHVWPGQHENAYWARHWDDYLRFYADALEHCHDPA